MADGQNNISATPTARFGSMPSQAMAPDQGVIATPTVAFGGGAGVDGGEEDTTHNADIIPETTEEKNGLLGVGGMAKEAVNFIPNALSNFGASAMRTVTGTAEGMLKHPAVYGQPLAEAIPQGTRENIANAIESGTQRETEPMGGPMAKVFGYGGESLMEFLAAEPAFAKLGLAERLSAVSKITKILQESPRTMNIARIGAAVSKVLERAGVSSVQAGTVAGLQTFLKSGGDFKQAWNDAWKTGAVALPLSTATEAASEVGENMGGTATRYGRLKQAAGNAATKEQVATGIQGTLKSAEQQMHDEYEAGFQNIADRTQGHTILSTHTPLAEAAAEALHVPGPGVSSLEASLDKKIGEGLDPRTRELLTELSTGVSADDQKAYETALRAARHPEPTLGVNGQPLTDAQGRPVTHMPEQPTTPVPHEFTGQELVRFRQKIRKLSEEFDYGNINSRTLRGLISSFGDRVSPMDETLGQLAGQFGDNQLVNDYRQMRQTYMAKHDVFENNKVIDDLMAGKVDDAAKGFLTLTREGVASPTTGRAMKNIRDLRTIIGDDGVHAFGRQVFGTVLRDSTEPNGAINPDRFFNTLQRFDSQTADQLFDWADARNGLEALKNDAQSTAILQKFTRAGVLSGVGALGGAFPHVGLGTLVGMVAGEGGGMGGIAKGRVLLDWIALHPKTWAMWERFGRAATSPTGKVVAGAMRYGAGKVVEAVQGEPMPGEQNQLEAQPSPEKKAAEQKVYGGLGSTLGGK